MAHFKVIAGPISKICLFTLLILILASACKDKTTTPDSSNNPPDEPYSPYPANGSTDVEVAPRLSWQCADPDSDLLLYDIYFGKTNPPHLMAERWPNKHFQIGSPLDYDTTYYWKIIAIDFNSARTGGNTWGFSTLRQMGLYLAGICHTSGDALNAFAIRDEIYTASADLGVEVFDITNPTIPDSMGIYEYPDIMATDVFVEGNYAFVTDANHGLHIVDVGNPFNPYTAAFVNLPGAPMALTVRGNHAYVVCDTAGLQIVNIQYILSPYLESGLPFLDAPANNISINGNYACVTCGTRGLYIVDISNTAEPVLLSIYDSPGVATSVFMINRSDSLLAYLADGAEGYKVLDLTNPANPTPVYEYPLSGFAYDICRDSSFIYVADGGAGLIMIDDTEGVQVVASYVTLGSARSVFVRGGTMYVSDGVEGVAILEYMP